MAVNEWEWTSRDGLEMCARGWIPEEQPKAVVCLVHGLGEHVNRYNHIGEAFARAGYALQGFDLRGHGQSGGLRGYIAVQKSFFHSTKQSLRNLSLRAHFSLSPAPRTARGARTVQGEAISC